MNVKDKIVSFAKRKNKVYVYGAGIYGNACCHVLIENGIEPAGYLVSSCDRVQQTGNYPVYVANEILPKLTNRDGVILALKERFWLEVKNDFCRMAMCPFLFMEDSEWVFLSNESFFYAMEELGNEYPCRQFTGTESWRHILIVRLDIIGDMIWTTAFFRELRRNFPQATISLVLNRTIVSLLENCPYVDQFIPYDCTMEDFKSRDMKHIREKTFRFAKQYLVDQSFDVVFLPRWFGAWDIIENVYLAVYSSAKVRIARVDFLGSRLKPFNPCIDSVKKLFSVISECKETKHEVERILDLLRICHLQVRDTRMELWPSEERVVRAKELLQKGEGHIKIATGLTGSEMNRAWPIEMFKELFHRIGKRFAGKVKFVLLGGKDLSGMNTVFREYDECIDLIGETSLSEAAAVIGECDFYFGPDTSLLHMASAMSRPSIEIAIQLPHGNPNSGRSPKRMGAWGVDSIVLQPRHGLDGLCEQAGNCVKDYAHCITQITVDEAEEAVVSMIERHGNEFFRTKAE